MLSTAGKEGLSATGKEPERVADCRTLAGRLRCGDYKLLEQPKTVRDKEGKEKTVTTWTWRISPTRYREWEALLVDRAKVRDLAEIGRIFECLRRMPMFSGIRYQVIRLAAETNKLLGKTGAAPLEMPKLPTMRMQKLWTDGSVV